MSLLIFIYLAITISVAVFSPVSFQIATASIVSLIGAGGMLTGLEREYSIIVKICAILFGAVLLSLSYWLSSRFEIICLAVQFQGRFGFQSEWASDCC